jgi:hypothetical protein
VTADDDRLLRWATAPTEIQQLRTDNARLLAEVDLYRARLRFLGGLISTSLTAVQEAVDVLMDVDAAGTSLSLVRHHLQTTTPPAAGTADGETTPTNP